MQRSSLLAALVACCFLGAEVGAERKWDFESAALGELPEGWSAARTGSGAGSVWKVEEDDTAPSGARVLAQTSAEGPGPSYNLCIANEPAWADLDIGVSLKALGGKIDQGGGLVWRLRDADNYYIARFNPLEENFRAYKVVNGKRTQLETADVEAPAGAWHAMRVTQRGDHIQCHLNGQLLLNVKDATFTKGGKIGLWTKADAVTRFDALSIREPAALPLTEHAPNRVYVVNTQDASVSLVDIKTMRELKRFPVGPRPYGIAVTRDGRTVAVGVEDEQKVKFFDAADFAPRGEVSIGKMFNDHIILADDDRRLLVADFHSDAVFVIDMATMKEATRIEGCSAAHVVKYGPLRKNAYVTCKKELGIAVIDPVRNTLLRTHSLNVNPRSLTFAPDESKVYFGSFWVDGFFELDATSGKVTRLFKLDPPSDNAAPQEVTYHGVEAVGGNIVLAANEGRSYVDAVDVTTGALLDRLTDVSKPCCIERIPGTDGPTRVLVSNLGDGTVQLVEVSPDGQLKTLGRANVGQAPKRVAFPPNESD